MPNDFNQIAGFLPMPNGFKSRRRVLNPDAKAISIRLQGYQSNAKAISNHIAGLSLTEFILNAAARKHTLFT